MYVEIRDLIFKYKNSQLSTINKVNLSISRGEIIAILGQSGSGKSTILRLLAGLEKPCSGTIVIDNKVMFDNNTYVNPENRGVGMVFQDYALFPHMTVEKNIIYGLAKLDRKERTKRLKEVLTLVNLEEFRDRYPYELSGGQQQRVALARALAPKPAVLLLDEPFSNLDADLRCKIRDELKRIIKDVGITSIFVTHDQEDAISLADRVVYLHKGTVLKVKTKEEYGTG
ncbi:ABC transporter ATP-binding protein [Desulforamulus hydrothermalis]|uniref:ABC-type quaternary amine transporter n=1 Tax=Desulforamulus hydrothermalis Lam5 = DSM 18033 TaxID=1121428 RepID=K8DZ33_9FIRM|nr:ABC transporter ATP-binding protein [Desulforamulus hydrothermalis]CCO08145.1 ABC transporter related protein [Desulforamulus hydrothermalis Lam5 = DSM 18033]SHH48267.1 iron(III) transport system ATP-binding protein [Desulforamulus hydrothermalis Lam5 = DSM 18033]